MGVRSGYQHVNGIRLWVHRFRDASVAPSGLTVILVHGFMDAGATWDLVAPALARAGHDVVAPDLRGFGQSDYVGPGGYYHFPDYVADLADLIDALAPRRLAMVGHSMGGTVAALYAGSHPDRLERLALIEGMGPVATETAVAVDRMQAWLRSMREVGRAPKPLSSLKEAVERLSLHHPRVPREIIESRARLLTRADDAGRIVWAYDPLHRTTSPTPFHVEAFKEFLKRIDCPTLVVGGGPAGWHPPDEDARAACIPHLVRFELPNAGHMMHWTEPAALAERLGAFFGEPAPLKTPTRRAQGLDAPAGGAPSAHAAPAARHAPPDPNRSPSPPAAAPSGAGASAGPQRHAPAPMAAPAGQYPVTPTRPAAGSVPAHPTQESRVAPSVKPSQKR